MMPTLAPDSDVESVSCVGVRAAPKLNTPSPRQATSTGGANTARQAISTDRATTPQSTTPIRRVASQLTSTQKSLQSTGHTDSESTPQSQASRRARRCVNKSINYDDYGKTRRSKSARAGKSPLKHRSVRSDVINRVGNMEEDSEVGNKKRERT